jgi:GT2 family glycosyltransferase
MVAIVTINYNLHFHTIQCVNSLLNSDYYDIHIFLIDNGSEKDDYLKLVKAFSSTQIVTILRIDQNRGYVGGINYGLEAAIAKKPDYFLIMNNDTIIDRSAISELVCASVRYNNKAIISGKVYYYDSPDILQHTGIIFKDKRFLTTTYPGRNEKDIGQCDEETERDSLDDVFWLLPSEVVEKTGLYCNYFFLYAEQGDYAQRAKRLCFKLIYTPKAKIWHKESMTAGGGKTRSPAIYYWRAQGRFIFQYRNLKKQYFYATIFSNFLKYIARAVFSKGENQIRNAATFRGYLNGFKWLFHQKPNTGYNPYL